MWSKLYRAHGLLRLQKVPAFQAPGAQKSSFRLPWQYEQPASDNFHLLHVLRYHWELTPLFFCIVFDMVLVGAAIYYGFKDRVDVQLTGHNWNCISRNMDLRHPTIHKQLVFNQQYKPWPRMQDVLDKMAEKEYKPIGSLAFRQKQDILAPGFLAPRRPAPEVLVPKRSILGGLVPENQYENNAITRRFQLGYCLTHCWETIPLFVCVIFDFFVIFYGGCYTGFSKLDLQFTGHNWNCKARNMDMNHPTIHKHLVHHQKYEPWPELQAVLDKMKKAEHRWMVRAKGQCD